MRHLVAVLALAGLAAAAMGQTTATKPASAPRAMEQAPAADQPDSTGLYNAALLELGATARGTGGAFNKDWPADDTMVTRTYNGGTMFDKPARSRAAAWISAWSSPWISRPSRSRGWITTARGSPRPSTFSSSASWSRTRTCPTLRDSPAHRVDAHGQNVGILVTDEYPPPRRWTTAAGGGCGC